MAKFANSVLFTPTLGGTTDWTVSAAVQGFMTPAQAAAADGVYKYRAESADLSQWEVGEGTYTGSGPTLTRTTVLQNSAGTTAKINFSTVPNVAIVALKQDLLSIEEANSWTYLQKAWGRANLDVSRKNYILNGGMQISQENGTTAGTTNNYYPVDQWAISVNSVATAAYSIAQVAAVTPGGSTHRIRLTVTAAQATVGSTSINIMQKIEGLRGADLFAGFANAKTVTVQVGVKAPVSGTYGVLLSNVGAAVSVFGTFTIAPGEVGTDVSKTVTLALPTTGTWATDNTPGIHVSIYLMTSSQTANVWATNGNVFELFDVGIYEGAAAPSFVLPIFDQELLSCQRYWEKSYDLSVAPGATNSNGCEGYTIGASAATFNLAAIYVRMKTRKRTAPTVAIYSDTTGASNKIRDRANSVDVTPTATDLIGETGFRTYCSVTAGALAALSCHWTANSRM